MYTHKRHNSRVNTVIFGLFLVFCLAHSSFARGQELAPLTAQETTPLSTDRPEASPEKPNPAGSLILEDGNQTQIFLTPIPPREVIQKPNSALTYGLEVTIAPVIGVLVLAGGELADGKVDLGASAGFAAGGGDGRTINFFGGAYAQLAPIPGEVGQRFFLRGKMYYVFTLQQIESDVAFRPPGHNFLAGGAIGYRHFSPQKRRPGQQKNYWSVEAGVLRLFGNRSYFLFPALGPAQEPWMPSLSFGVHF